VRLVLVAGAGLHIDMHLRVLLGTHVAPLEAVIKNETSCMFPWTLMKKRKEVVMQLWKGRTLKATKAMTVIDTTPLGA